MEYRYQQEVAHDAWYLRFYGWLYGADPLKADFCKLVWATMFAPLVLILRIVTLPFVPLVNKLALYIVERDEKKGEQALEQIIEDAKPESVKVRMQKEKEEREKRQQIAQIKYERKLRWSDRWDRVAAFCSRWADKVVDVVQKIIALKAIKYLAMGILLLIALAAGSWMVYILVITFTSWWMPALLAVAGVCTFMGVIAALAYIGSNPTVKEGANDAGEFVKMNTLGFFGALKRGVIGIKSRTCPQIIVVDKEGEPILAQPKAAESKHI